MIFPLLLLHLFTLTLISQTLNLFPLYMIHSGVLQEFPQYLKTLQVDTFRGRGINHSHHICLDYTGHSLLSYSQQQQNSEFVPSSSSSSSVNNLLPGGCNDNAHFEICHKVKGSSNFESDFEFKLKERIMSYLNISKDDYSMFFTANEASGFQVLSQVYPFQSNKNLLTVYDHENEAVETMIKGSRSRGAQVSSAEFKWPKLKIHCQKLEEMVMGKNRTKQKKGKGLFVFPTQSRVTGARYSYQWMNLAQNNGWHVLLDATSLGAKEMDTLGLSLFKPDFLICTFYKVFGQDPSGFCCLFVKKSNIPNLIPSNISSTPGIVSLNVTSYCREMKECVIECGALDMANSLGLVLIGTRTRCLINWIVNGLEALSHPNSEKDAQLVRIYGPRVRFDRGPCLAFNIFDWKGEKVDPSLVQKLADRNNISVGGGFIMHVWFNERYEDEKMKVLEKRSKEEENNKGKRREITENGISVVTVSIGYLNNFEDVYRLWEFVAKFLDADFVDKERWRYTALNQKTLEV